MGNDPIENNYQQVITDILSRLRSLETRDVKTGSLDEISSDMGDIDAGRFIASSSGTGEPTDPNFSGSFMSAEGETFDGELWNIGGVNGGELQFGLSAETGKAYFAGGAAIIDRTGFTMTGLNYSVLQTADNGTTDPNPRYGWLEMFMPSGSSVPAWGLTYSDSTGSPITNGDFETGDLTGWTDSGTDFTVTEAAAGSGTYGLECADITAGTATLTSDRFAVTAGLPYFFRFSTKEHGYTSGTDNIEITQNIHIRNDLVDSNFVGGKILVGKVNLVTFRSLLWFDLSKYRSLTKFSSVILNLYHNYEEATNSRTMRVYRMLRSWIENEATWNNADTSNSWGAAGASDTSTDRESTDIGSISLSATESNGWKQIVLNTTKTEDWPNSVLDNYGIQLKMDTESSDYHSFESRNSSTKPYLSTVYTTPSDYEIRVDFYDAVSGGSLISSVTLCTEYNAAGWRQVNKQVVPPVGAVSAEIVIVSGVGMGFRVDDLEMLFSRSLYCTDDGWDSSQGLWRESYFGAFTEWRAFTAAGVEFEPDNRTLIGATTSGTQMNASTVQASDGDYYTNLIALKKGTYKFSFSYVKTSAAGKIDLYTDGIKVNPSTLDMNGSGTNNQWDVTGISVAYNGVHEFKIVVNGKTGSDYVVYGSLVNIVRTA